MRVVSHRTALPSLSALLGLALVAAAPTAEAQQPGALDPTFNVADDGTFGNGSVSSSLSAIALQPDGRIVITGSLASYHGTTVRGLVRTLPNGALDPSFAVTAGMTGGAGTALALQSDGSILVGGTFTTYASTPRGRIARVSSTGAFDGTFATGAGASGTVRAIDVQSDGRILIAGEFAQYDTVTRGRVARLLPDGSLDTSFAFGPGADGNVLALVEQPDGRVLVAGDFAHVDGVPRARVARLLTDGSVDPSFDPGLGPDAIVRALAVQADGDVLIAGDFQNVSGASRGRVARLEPDGSLDAAFAAVVGTDGPVHALALQPGGTALVAGEFANVDGAPRARIARVRADGTNDPTFHPGAGVTGAVPIVSALATQTDGNVLLGGSFSFHDGRPRRNLARIHADGAIDLPFRRTMGADGVVHEIETRADGSAWIQGFFFHYNDEPRSLIALVAPDGSVDPTFPASIGAGANVYAIEALPDGDVVVGGGFSEIHGLPREDLVRLNPDGSLDPSLVSEMPVGVATAIDVVESFPDGRLLIVGSFTSYGGAPRPGLARVFANGQLDPSFVPGTGANQAIRSVVVLPDARIVLAGDFTTFDGVPHRFVVRLLEDGSIDPSFSVGVGPSQRVVAVTAYPDGRLLIGGQFTTVAGVTNRSVARLLASGALDTSFQSGFTSVVSMTHLTIQPDGKAILAGDFDSYGGRVAKGVVRANGDGSVDTAWGQPTGTTGTVYVVRMLPDGKYLLGGLFDRFVDGTWKNGLARIQGFEGYPSFCSGDGSGTACPCGNSGAAARGCANSVSASGARLVASGTASLAGDGLVLQGDSMPNSSALYFQGTTMQAGGAGAVFGDGLRCAGGSTVRLGTKTNVLGVSTYPGPGDLAVSVRGGVASPAMRTYQIWYRNAATFCTTSTFNLTNGVRIDWQL